MKGKSTGLVIGLAVIVGFGFTLYVLSAPGAPIGVVVGNTTGAAQTSLAGPALGKYDCNLPAQNSQNFCDKLPAGYQIPSHLPNAPQPYCPAGMTSSACQLLKQTWGNGACDPNETVWTDPLDCGCTGAVVGDPFTGRCGAPATVCQLQAQQEAKAAAGG
jgi:hypothetical protein